MGLREELEKEMGDAMQRIPLVLKQTVYGGGQATGDPIEQIKEVIKAQLAVTRIQNDAILRLASEIDALTEPT